MFSRKPLCSTSTIRSELGRLFRMANQPRPSSLIRYLEKIRKELAASKGAGIGILTDEQTSPTRDRLLRSLKEQFPQIGLYSYEPLGFEEPNAAVTSLFGPDVAIKPAFANADIIVSLDCDFVGSELTLQGVRDFSRRRRVQGSTDAMNRLYAVENRFTTTGGMADHRLRCAASQIPAFAIQLAKKVASSTTDRVLNGVVTQLKDTGGEFDDAWLTECANDLVARKGRSLVLVGNRYPAWVHGLVLAMNNALDAFGSTLEVFSAPRVKMANLRELVADAKSQRDQNAFCSERQSGLYRAGRSRLVRSSEVDPGSHSARLPFRRDLRARRIGMCLKHISLNPGETSGRRMVLTCRFSR